MNLENQVCSLELSKRLKELGVKQESYFYWHSFRNESSPKEQWSNVYNQIIRRNEKTKYKNRDYLKDQILYSAFTVAELGEMLPAYTNDNGDKQLLELSKYIIPVGEKKGNSTYSAEYWTLNDPIYRLGKGCYEDNESDARAKMLIYLLENKLMELPNE